LINIIKSGVGNLGSLIRVIEDLEINYNIINNRNDFNQDWKIILPGVGTFDSFVNSLKNQNLFEKIKELVLINKIPILGICVGMQSLFDKIEEGEEDGLSFIEGKCKKFDNNVIKVPHIGWNNIEILNHCSLFVDLKNDYFYFSHSYHVSLLDKNLVLSVTNYDYDFFQL